MKTSSHSDTQAAPVYVTDKGNTDCMMKGFFSLCCRTAIFYTADVLGLDCKIIRYLCYRINTKTYRAKRLFVSILLITAVNFVIKVKIVHIAP